jgi:hypothetical protein
VRTIEEHLQELVQVIPRQGLNDYDEEDCRLTWRVVVLGEVLFDAHVDVAGANTHADILRNKIRRWFRDVLEMPGQDAPLSVDEEKHIRSLYVTAGGGTVVNKLLRMIDWQKSLIAMLVRDNGYGEGYEAAMADKGRV